METLTIALASTIRRKENDPLMPSSGMATAA
jgi:hypothetical protein